MSDNNRSDDDNNKKRKAADGSAVVVAVPVKVESSSGSPQQGTTAIITPPDHSDLSPVEKIILVKLLKDDSDAVRNALIQLASLCQGDGAEAAKVRDELVQLGGLSTIVGAMKKWYAFPAIQAAGCRALTFASYRNHDFKKSAKRSKTLDAIIWAMKNYPHDVRVQIYASCALSNFVRIKQTADHAIKCNVVELVVTAMNSYKEKLHVQWSGSWVLCNLLSWDDDEIKKAVLKTSGDAQQALFNAIKIHNDESKGGSMKELQTHARSALKKLL